jgi:hypothetical protein
MQMDIDERGFGCRNSSAAPVICMKNKRLLPEKSVSFAICCYPGLRP